MHKLSTLSIRRRSGISLGQTARQPRACRRREGGCPAPVMRTTIAEALIAAQKVQANSAIGPGMAPDGTRRGAGPLRAGSLDHHRHEVPQKTRPPPPAALTDWGMRRVRQRGPAGRNSAMALSAPRPSARRHPRPARRPRRESVGRRPRPAPPGFPPAGRGGWHRSRNRPAHAARRAASRGSGWPR